MLRFSYQGYKSRYGTWYPKGTKLWVSGTPQLSRHHVGVARVFSTYVPTVRLNQNQQWHGMYEVPFALELFKGWLLKLERGDLPTIPGLCPYPGSNGPGYMCSWNIQNAPAFCVTPEDARRYLLCASLYVQEFAKGMGGEE